MRRSRTPRTLVDVSSYARRLLRGGRLFLLQTKCILEYRMEYAEPVQLSTSDGLRLAADWYPVAQPRGWALLLHMMPATKESYAALAVALQEQGIASLACDFRGHGASDGGPTGYEAFTDAQQQAKRLDVEAGAAYLVELGMVSSRFVLVGASIGANLALQHLAAHPDVPAAVLLSPGMNYRGVYLAPLAGRIAPHQRVLLAAGGSDDAYSTKTVTELADIIGVSATSHVFTRAGHGTAMFEREPSLLTTVVRWMIGCFA